ncbi:MAG: Lrp/AsnC family transcriptional regulator [Sphingomonas bacterium]|jgi:Lrp/AsnC family leucine-responsive transcriptional regulator|nr:Lrp/AsnC family transcriptional regulator [Sphingomonas bacterium]MDB5717156.1 Lrp/AsnC family transcriptional regulator [Sphingomonas bacterium]
MTDLSRTDYRILQALQEDGSLSNVALAERVGMSPSPCLRRVKQLEAAGLIRRYVALIDQRKLGFGITAFVEVKVPQVAGEPIVESFKEAVRREPAITACYLMAGQFDFLLKVVATDMDAYSALTQETLLKLPGVRDLRTSFILDAFKETTELPLMPHARLA